MRRGFLFLGADPAADAMDARRLQRDRLRDRIPGPDCIPSGAQQERSGRRRLPCGGGPVAGWQAIRTRYSHPLFAPAIRHPLLAIRYSPQNSRQPPASCRTVALSDRRTQPCTGTRGRSFSFRHAVPSGQRSCRWCRIKKSPSVADGDSQAFKPLLTEPERLPELPSCPWPFRAWHRPECRGPVSRSA